MVCPDVAQLIDDAPVPEFPRAPAPSKPAARRAGKGGNRRVIDDDGDEEMADAEQAGPSAPSASVPIKQSPVTSPKSPRSPRMGSLPTSPNPRRGSQR